MRDMRARRRAVRQELQTIAVVVSAALSALFVHYALDQAQASPTAIHAATPKLFKRLIPILD